MTLILALGNSEQMMQISDRRHTVDGRPVHDEKNKATVLTCINGRFAVGFTGLAEVASFRTQDWILDNLLECGPPDHTIFNILARFKSKSNSDFLNKPALRQTSKQNRRVSLLFSGYLDHHSPPMGAYALLTNYQDVNTGRDSSEAWDRFELVHYCERRPANEEMTLVQRIGAWPAFYTADEAELRNMLMTKKPEDAIRRKAYAVLRRVSRRPVAKETIGCQLSSIIIRRDPGEAIGFDYDTSTNSDTMWGPDMVWLSPEGSLAMKGLFLAKVADPGAHRPAFVPRVRPDQPCPCGSGSRYKHCHGKA